MPILCRHIAANCNPQPHVLAFLDPHTLLFAFSNQLGLYHIPSNRITRTLKGTSALTQTPSTPTTGPTA
jgi:hypothetical protein